MTNKADIIRRQRDMLEQLDNDTFNRQEFMDKHHILDRTLRRDLNALAERGEIYENKLTILRKKCLGKITKKVNDGDLSDKLMVSIIMSGETKRTSIDADVNITGLNEGINTLIKFSQQPDDTDGS